MDFIAADLLSGIGIGGYNVEILDLRVKAGVAVHSDLTDTPINTGVVDETTGDPVLFDPVGSDANNFNVATTGRQFVSGKPSFEGADDAVRDALKADGDALVMVHVTSHAAGKERTVLCEVDVGDGAVVRHGP